MNGIYRITAGVLAVMSLLFCGCNNKNSEDMQEEIIPTVKPYAEPGETDENTADAVYTVDSDMNATAPDGTTYTYYTSQKYIYPFSDFNLYGNIKNYLGYVEGQKLTQDVWNELGFNSYDDYKAVNGDFEYGVYGINNIPGEDKTDESPKLIMVYFYNKEEEKTYAESQDEAVMKARIADFYCREDLNAKTFDYVNCSAFVLLDGSLTTDEDVRDNGGIRDKAEVAEFIEYLQTAPTLTEKRIDDEYYSYLYKHFYNKSTNKFNDSPEYEEAKKQRKTLRLVGVFEDNDAFGIKFSVEKYGKYGYSVNIDGVDYVISDKWAEKLLA